MKKNTKAILEALEREYGTEYVCYLNHENALQLLIATMLSAQCTDARVNIVTESLFKKYITAKDFANANLKEISREIYQKEEESRELLPAYSEYNSKQLSKMTHLEEFEYSVWDQGECKKLLEKQWMIFDYNERNPLNMEARIILM